ncbi:hypothetical protein Tsp_03105 [Trichinella spiralis]|uniref:hypothetical protein n=1 Tax=Trichinella spiralis TaxID=6334 RepID=UPI0001EFB9DF|nr:hypothetical protein Tsp_03105 [Trichinella spiralis]
MTGTLEFRLFASANSRPGRRQLSTGRMGLKISSGLTPSRRALQLDCCRSREIDLNFYTLVLDCLEKAGQGVNQYTTNILLYSITTTFGMKNQRKIAYGYWNTLAPDDANFSNVVIKLVPVTLSE